MANQMSMKESVTILSTHVVKPAGEQAHEGPLDLSAWDQLFGLVHNKTVLFFKHNPGCSSELDRVVETLLGSLGLALAQFSPLAGRLRWVDREERRLEIVCNGEGAEVVVAECDAEMSSFRGYTEPERLTLLVPEVNYERPLEEVPVLLVRVTRFRCGGMALGFSMNHISADGQSAFHFICEWARLARGDPMKEAPSLLYRTMFRERDISKQINFSGHIEFQDLPSLMPSSKEDGEEGSKKTVRLALSFTKAQLDALKKDASSYDNGDAVSPRFSRYEVVTAHLWRCLCKARRNEYEQETAVSFPIDIRKKMQTIPLPKATFGNLIITMRAMSRAGDLISNPLGFSCAKIREAINSVDEDYIWSNFEFYENQDDLASITPKKSKFHNGNPNLKVTSWLSLPIQNIDFGWGNMIEITPLFRDIDGLTVLLPHPTNDGSVIVLLSLQMAHADDFKKHFYKDIN